MADNGPSSREPHTHQSRDEADTHGPEGYDATDSDPRPDDLTVEQLEDEKRLPRGFLKQFDVITRNSPQGKHVVIPYYDEHGQEAAVRRRFANRNFRWRKGDKVLPYGRDRLREARGTHKRILIVEGESDVWAGTLHGILVIGIPGKNTWKSDWAAYLDGFEEVYVWQEPDANDFTMRIAESRPDVRVIVGTDYKDPSDIHVALGDGFVSYMEDAFATARTVEEINEAARIEQLKEVAAAAADVVDHDDPWDLVQHALSNSVYGGDTTPVLITYLALTARVLPQRKGSLPPHTLIKGPSSVGKSAAVKTVTLYLPDNAYHELHAGSPRVLIYDDADLQHRGIIVSEADSLPAGEDNPAASAVRNLLQDGNLNYKVVEKDDEGQFAVRHINRPGPSVLITTATRSLGDQLMTRLFTVEIEERPSQIRGALNRIADLELGPIPEPDPALIAYQEYLQALAPIDVVVPFARQITDYIGRQPNPTRILRDSARILSLIKAVTVLRHHHRARDEARRYFATVDDYAVVYHLLKDIYTTTVTGIDKEVRDIVALVASLKQEDRERRITTADLFPRIDLGRDKVRRRLSRAQQGGWLINRKDAFGNRFGADDWDLGEPLPPTDGLPDPTTLRPSAG